MAIDWQPMATAPMPEDEVLLYDKSGEYWIGHFSDAHQHWVVEEGYIIFPTHWAALNAPDE